MKAKKMPEVKKVEVTKVVKEDDADEIAKKKMSEIVIDNSHEMRKSKVN